MSLHIWCYHCNCLSRPMLYIPEYPFSFTTLCLLYLRVAFLCFTGFILFPCLSNTPWSLCGRITSSPPLFHTGLTLPARLPALVLSWLCHVSVTLLQTKNGFSKTTSPFLMFFHLSTFPFHSLFCITHPALNQILKKSHIIHKLHCLFMVCKKICKGQFHQHSFRNRVPLSMVQLWHMLHPFILLVSWEFLKSPQPFHFSLLHIATHALELQATLWGISSSAPVPPPPQTLCQEPYNNYPYSPLCCHVQNLLSGGGTFWRSSTYFCLWYTSKSQVNALCQAYSSSLELQPVMMSSAS